MFILIPLILILASVGGILFIVSRKLPHLKKLAEAESSNGVPTENGWYALVYDLCPEVWDWTKSIKVKEYKEVWFIETEKLLRRLRLVSLKMDRFSDSLIKKIRSRTYSNGGLTYTGNDERNNGQAPSDLEAEKNEKEEFKKAEQKLILEIAKNPKSTVLYEELGNLYAKMGDYRDAKESYEAAIELNPNNEELKKKLSFALEKLNKLEDSQS